MRLECGESAALLRPNVGEKNMTHDELVVVARQGNYIKWTRSGVIEWLWTTKGSIFARGLFTRRHFIARVDEAPGRTHHCELIHPAHTITLGEQYAAAKRTKWFRGE